MIAPEVPGFSPRAVATARLFGLRLGEGDVPRWRGPFDRGGEAATEIARLLGRCLAPGQIALVAGASGAGKSTLLQLMESAARCPAINLCAIHLPQQRCVDCFPALSLERTLALLSRFGLGEVWTYLRTPQQLSDGERFRLRLAMAWHLARRLARRSASGRAMIVADEFASSLDRVSARVISRSFRRQLAGDPRLLAVLATAHDDLGEALSPDWLIRCDFGEWRLYRGAASRSTTLAQPAGAMRRAAIH